MDQDNAVPNFPTWDSKEKLIEILEGEGKFTEALSVAREHSKTMEEKIGFENDFGGFFTWKAKGILIDLLEKTGQAKEARSVISRLLKNEVKVELLFFEKHRD